MTADTAKNEASEDRIVVTGIGLVTPMAGTAWHSIAALKRNRSRFFAHPTVLVAEDRYGTSLRGATVSRTSLFERHGLQAPELACALLAPAIRESVAGLLKAPSGGLSMRVINGLCPEDERFLPLLGKQLPYVFADAGIVRRPVERPGRHSFLEHIIEASEALKRTEHKAAVIAATDSLCFPPVLQSLMEADRLISGSNPEGIIAGEAAGALLLEREKDARHRGAPIYAAIASWGRDRDPLPSISGSQSLAQGLAAAFRQAAEGRPAQLGITPVILIIGDLNGERSRALQWAYAEGRVFSNSQTNPHIWLPAFSAGDCGLAMGAVQSITATGILAKGDGGDGGVAVFCTDDNGEARVVIFSKGEFQDRHALNRWRRRRHSQMMIQEENPWAQRLQ